jgi:hypothetical protein
MRLKICLYDEIEDMPSYIFDTIAIQPSLLTTNVSNNIEASLHHPSGEDLVIPITNASNHAVHNSIQKNVNHQLSGTIEGRKTNLAETVDDPTKIVVNDYIPLTPKIADIPSAKYGTFELKAALLALCLEYADIFSRSVRDTKYPRWFLSFT